MRRHAPMTRCALTATMALGIITATPLAGAPAFAAASAQPEAPVVTSEEYPDDDLWHTGVGSYGTFTFDSPSPDVTAYRYRFWGDVRQTVTAEESGGPATVRWLPEDIGAYSVEVQALNSEGDASPVTSHTFWVTDGLRPVGRWKLDDTAGSTAAADSGTGGHSAMAGGGVRFGADGPEGGASTSTAELDGSDAAYLAPDGAAVDSSGSFTLSAWVRPDGTGTDRYAVGTAASALGLSLDSASDDWRFTLPSAGGTLVSARGGNPDPGEWAHLTGVYDAVARTARLYVNGTRTAEVEDVDVDVEAAAGGLRIGTGGEQGGANWDGALADVTAWNRIVVPGEIKKLAALDAARVGLWTLNEAPGGVSPEYGGGQSLTLGGGASLYTPGEDDCPWNPDCTPVPPAISGAGHLELDGDGDFTATAGPVVATDGSFTVSALVRLNEPFPARDMAVLSQAGAHNNAFVVRYSAAERRWTASVTGADSADATVTTLTGHSAPASGDGTAQSLVLVYDDAADEIRLYVGGILASKASFDSAWAAGGSLQVGRALTAGGWGEYLDGDVDVVRAYRGAVPEDQVGFLQWEFGDV